MNPVDEVDLNSFGYRVLESSLRVERNSLLMIVQNKIESIVYANEL